MDKKLLKEFAMKSRETLTALVRAKLTAMHIDEDVAWTQSGEVYQAIIDSQNIVLTADEKQRYDDLKSAVRSEGVKAIVEKAAYTWFNRIVAIRYMELNEMLPQGSRNEWLGIRVLSDADNHPDPEILKASNLRRTDLSLPLDTDAILKLSRDDEKFREVLFAIVRKLGGVMPDVFNGETASINFLLPDNLLGAGGFVNEILKLPTSCFDKVEVIGWLYQYYNQAEKDIAMKKKTATLKDEIPFVTQIFTPDWIVKYMVENSLGRYWLEHGGDPNLADNWKYLIKNGASTTTTTGEIANIEDVTFIDPAMGSGHILVYAFEVFYQIYLSLGYTPDQIPEKILTHNLYGLDIDDRAKQLSILSAMLVAREHDKDIFNKQVQLNITSIAESNGLNSLPSLVKGASRDTVEYLVDTFRDAKEYGSILRIKRQDYSDLQAQLDSLSPLDSALYHARATQLIHQADILSRKYTIAVTNPPYMDKYGKDLAAYLKEYYTASKSNMASVFIEVCMNFLEQGGLLGMITPDAWLFLSGHAKLRELILSDGSITSMIHAGSGVFDGIGLVVIPTAFTIEKIPNLDGIFIRLTEKPAKGKVGLAENAISDINHKLRYRASKTDFEALPGKIIAYWASDAVKRAFIRGVSLSPVASPCVGLQTGDNNRFVRIWSEVACDNLYIDASDASSASLSGKKWFPYNKGGEYRKWYGNNDFVVNWHRDGYEIKHITKNGKLASRPQNTQYYYKPSITWSKISFDLAFRYKPAGHIFDVAGTSVFAENPDDLKYLHGVLNSKVMSRIASFLSPTVNFEVGQVATYPVIQSQQYRDEVIRLVEENRALSKADWDSFETSWDFEQHPLLPHGGETKLADTYSAWERDASERWSQLKANEERLNEIFIEVYGMQDELTPEVEDKYVSVRKAKLDRDAKSLLSYFVGVIFGRYSLDKPGLNFAGGDWSASAQGSLVDADNIVPIMDGEYYTDDIVKKLRDFLVTVYGESTLHTNMDWLADALGRKSHEHAEDTLRRYFTEDFFADHFKVYGKCPIYWQLSSGKSNGFKALFYLHRYQPNLIATVRTQYLLNTQNIYTKRLAELDTKTTLNNDELRLKNDLVAKLAEIKSYDALIGVAASESIELDLDDGVKTNYPKLSHAAAGVKPGSEILEMKGVKL
ncbi:BREX-1 system adenine-specific DNA-methyltransferase PglX [Candidatus Saccharibacteria bacterium]|nr:BREX-1 system adenine-specific DNA-methyltransferase PglX [Candidatus Saccharibacteria bacterium]